MKNKYPIVDNKIDTEMYLNGFSVLNFSNKEFLKLSPLLELGDAGLDKLVGSR
jgi:hypothetical protein